MPSSQRISSMATEALEYSLGPCNKALNSCLVGGVTRLPTPSPQAQSQAIPANPERGAEVLQCLRKPKALHGGRLKIRKIAGIVDTPGRRYQYLAPAD